MQLLVPWEEAGLPLMLTVLRSRLRQVSWRLLAPYGITPQQYQVLRALADKPGLCHGELASALGLDKPTATRLLQTLERKGWVLLKPHPCHGRKLQLELSDPGQELIGRLASFRKTIREGLERDLSPEERTVLRGLLRKLFDNLDRMDAESDSGSSKP